MATKKAETPVDPSGLDEFAEVAQPEPVVDEAAEAEKAAAKVNEPATTEIYTEATTELREAHKDEFQAILERRYAEAGLTYVRRLTAEERKAVVEAEKREKARAKLEELYAKYPELRP